MLTDASEIAARETLGFGEGTLMWYDERALAANRELYVRKKDAALGRLVGRLVGLAEKEVGNGAVYAVNGKKGAVGAGGLHEYVSVAPFHWRYGGQYVVREGLRSAEEMLYTVEGERFDRTRWASFSGNVSVLTLAGYFSGNRMFFERAARMVRTWFVDEETRMEPHLRYAHMNFSKGETEGSYTGISEFVNVVTVFDMVRLLYKNEALSTEDMSGLKKWASEYGEFLQNSPQGHKAYTSSDHGGTLYDVQVAALAAFTGNFTKILWHTSLSRTRLYEQMMKDGSLKNEMKRKPQLHHMMYGLQAWVWLGRISERVGVDLWKFKGYRRTERQLRRGMRYCVPYFNRALWSHEEGGDVDMERMLFLYYHGKQYYGDLTEFSSYLQLGKHVVGLPKSLFDAKAVFHDFDLIPPFWNLAMAPTKG